MLEVRTVQTAFGQTASAPALAVTLPRPTAVGDTLSVHLRFSPLTGTPDLADNFGNRWRRTGTQGVDAVTAVAFFTATLVRAGAGHTVTATAQGGPQALEMGVSELSVLAPEEGSAPSPNDLLLAMLAQSHQQTALLQRLVTAQRA